MTPEEILHDILQEPGEYGLPPIAGHRHLTQGVVHHVWRLVTGQGNFYAKIRAETFARMPIGANPTDVRFEADAAARMVTRLPAHFPAVVCCRPERGLLILTDVVGSGKTLDALLLSTQTTTQMIAHLGEVLGTVHQAFAGAADCIREPDDSQFFELKLEHKLRSSGHSRLLQVADQLAHDESSRQLIIGDPSPKNVAVSPGVGAESIAFFDLEDVHRGQPAFDFGFLAGHLGLHNYGQPAFASHCVEVFRAAYRTSLRREPLAKAIAIGTILYRLDSIVPYESGLPQGAAPRLATKARELLDTLCFERVGWDALIREIASPLT